MWLPSDLITICHSIIDKTRLPPTTSVFQADHQHNHDTTIQSTPRPEHRKKPTQHAVFPLLQLPLDILALHLPAHLPYDSLISLHLSSRDLFAAIPIPKKGKGSKLTSCEREAILTAVEERTETRRCCVICRSWYPVALFTWVSDQQTAQASDARVGGDTMENRVCRWHRSRFERTLSEPESGQDQIAKQGWTREEACMHCGGVLAWGRCDCETSCQTCWKRFVWCHTRIVDAKATESDT